MENRKRMSKCLTSSGGLLMVCRTALPIGFEGYKEKSFRKDLFSLLFGFRFFSLVHRCNHQTNVSVSRRDCDLDKWPPQSPRKCIMVTEGICAHSTFFCVLEEEKSAPAGCNLTLL